MVYEAMCLECSRNSEETIVLSAEGKGKAAPDKAGEVGRMAPLL